MRLRQKIYYLLRGIWAHAIGPVTQGEASSALACLIRFSTMNFIEKVAFAGLLFAVAAGTLRGYVLSLHLDDELSVDIRSALFASSFGMCEK